VAAKLGKWLLAPGLLAFAIVLVLRPLADADLGWHLAQGRAIVALRGIPAIDPLAYTHRPIQRVDLLGEVLLYLIVRLAGPLGLQIAGAAAACATAVVLLVLTRDSAPFSRLIVAVAMIAISSWLLVRPAMLSFLFLPVLLLLLDLHRRAPTTPAGWRAMAFVVPLLFVWSNTHGFAVIGAAIAVLYAGSRVGARLARGRFAALLPAADGEAAWWTAGVVALGLLAMLVTPGGALVFVGPFRALEDVAAVTEWATTDAKFLYDTELAAGVLLVLGLSALVFGREPGGDRVPPLFDLLLFALAVVLGRSAIRLVPIAALLVVPFTARRLASLVPVTPLVYVASGVAMLLVAPVVITKPGTTFEVGFDRRIEPVGAADWILAAKPHGHMWNFSPYGGYLSWRLYPEHLVMIDGRTAWVHDPALVARAHASNFDLDVFRGLEKELEIDWAVSRAGPGEPFGAPLTRAAGWTMVYVDDYSAVYVRREGPNRPLAEAGYRLLDHLTPLERVLELAMSRSTDPAELRHDADLAVQQDPASGRAGVIEACAAIREGDRDRFVAAIERLVRIAPGNPAIQGLQQVWNAAPGR